MGDEDKTKNQLMRQLAQMRQRVAELQAAEGELRQMEERLRQFFENEPEYCYMISPEAVILDVNGAALERLGYTKEELVGKPLRTIYAPESLPKMKQLFPKWKETGELKDEEMVIITKEGDRRTVLLSAGAVRDKDGRVLHSVSVQKDITDLKRMEEATKRAYAQLNQIFNTAADGMCVIDEDFNVLRANETFSSLCGVSRDEAVGKKCYEILPGRTCHTPKCPLIRILAGEEHVEYEAEKERKDGTRIPCILTATPFRGPGGELIGVVEDFKDITDLKRAEEKLKEYSERLEEMVEERTRQLRESEARMRSLLENSPDSITIVDRDGKVGFQNRGIPGLTVEQAVGSSLYDLTEPEYHDEYRRILPQVFQSGQASTLMTRHLARTVVLPGLRTVSRPSSRMGTLLLQC